MLGENKEALNRITKCHIYRTSSPLLYLTYFLFTLGGERERKKKKTNEAAFFSEAVIISILQLVSLLELVFGLKSKSQLNRRTATKRVQQKAQLMINQVGAS